VSNAARGKNVGLASLEQRDSLMQKAFTGSGFYIVSTVKFDVPP
jgi:hypothetical protein